MAGMILYSKVKSRWESKGIKFQYSFNSYREKWEDLEKVLKEKNIDIDAFLDFYMEKVQYPYLKILFAKKNNQYKYVQQFLAFRKKIKDTDVISKETRHNILRKVKRLRTFLAFLYAEYQYRTQKQRFKKVTSLYDLVTEITIIYLSYLYYSTDFLNNFEVKNSVDKDIFEYICSERYFAYFPVISKIQKYSDKALKETYEITYKSYEELIEQVGEDVVHIETILGSIGSGILV